MLIRCNRGWRTSLVLVALTEDLGYVPNMMSYSFQSLQFQGIQWPLCGHIHVVCMHAGRQATLYSQQIRQRIKNTKWLHRKRQIWKMRKDDPSGCYLCSFKNKDLFALFWITCVSACVRVRIDWCVRRGRDITPLGARDTSDCELPEAGTGSWAPGPP